MVQNNTVLSTTKPQSRTNSLLELVKLFLAFVVLKAHGLTPIPKDLPWITTADITVEFFFVVMGWFLIRGINRHQEKNQDLGLWRSWWIFFKKKILTYLVPCIIPGLLTNILTLFYDGGIPNGMLWMYWFIHDAFVVMFIYYIIYFKIKDEKKRLIILSVIFVISYVGKFLLTNYFLGTVIIYDFPRALSCISFGMLCSKIPTPKQFKFDKLVAWVVCSIAILAEITVVVLPAQLMFGVDRIVFKDVINIVLFPLLIWSCLWVNLSLRPLNYIGKWSKGLYMWQMVPYSIMAIGKYYGIATMYNPYLLMSLVLALTILESPTRNIIKHINIKRQNSCPEYIAKKADRRKKINYLYWNKKTQIVLLSISLACFAAGASIGVYGLITSLLHNNFSFFMDPITKRNTFYCDAIVLLLGFTLIIGIFPINYYLTNKNIKKRNLI